MYIIDIIYQTYELIKKLTDLVMFLLIIYILWEFLGLILLKNT